MSEPVKKEKSQYEKVLSFLGMGEVSAEIKKESCICDGKPCPCPEGKKSAMDEAMGAK